MDSTQIQSWPPSMPLTPKLPRFVERNRAKGRWYYYVRVKGRRLATLPRDPESAEFFEAYASVMRKVRDDPQPRVHLEGSVGWLITSYKASPEFKSLAAKSQRDYDRQLERLKPIERFRAEDVKRRHIRAIRDKLSDTPRTQQYFGQVCSALFNYGIIELELEMLNPAAKLRRTDDPESYIPWSPGEMATFEASEPPVELMTAYMVARYTGPRRSDVVKLRRNHYDGQSLTIAGSKTTNPVTVRVHKALKAYLDKQPATLTIIADAEGRPVTPTALTHGMREHLDSIGLFNRHLHGLRHTAGTELAEAGCTSHQIQSVLGHKTLQMVEKYTKRAEQKRLANSAVLKLQRKQKRNANLPNSKG